MRRLPAGSRSLWARRGEGISRLVLEACDFLTKLPQRGETESLNVAQAATAMMFEWMRQNRGSLEFGAGE